MSFSVEDRLEPFKVMLRTWKVSRESFGFSKYFIPGTIGDPALYNTFVLKARNITIGSVVTTRIDFIHRKISFQK